MNDSAHEKLRSLFARLLRLDEAKRDAAADFNDVIAEAKAEGFVPVILRKAVLRARYDPADVLEADGLLETYEAIVGTGSGAAGTLQMKRNEEGVFEAKIVQGGDAADEKLSKRRRSLQSALRAAELEARAREDR